MRRILVAAILLAACSRAPEVPVNTLLWRVEKWQPIEQNVRRGLAEVVSFRANHEYVEHYCVVVEQPDKTVYIQGNGPHVITIGTWQVRGSQIVATRNLTKKDARYRGPELCGDVAFTVSGNSVVGPLGPLSPVTRLVSPDFEEYVKDAQRTGQQCPQPSR